MEIALSPEPNGRQIAIHTLRHQLGRVAEADRFGVVGTGVDVIDARLPGGGLALGALHEIAPNDFVPFQVRRDFCWRWFRVRFRRAAAFSCGR